MAYCTVADVVHELMPTLRLQMREHYDRIHGSDPDQPDFEQFITVHIERAEACANASLSRAYRIPLKQATTSVISAVCKIAAYFSCAAFTEKEEILKDKYELGMQMLEWLVEAEDAGAVDEDADDEDDKAFNGARWGTDARIFTADELKKW